MDLILWRHAHAETARQGQDDMHRRLTAKGIEQSRIMAKWLAGHIPSTTKILSSPATRARQTADALRSSYEIIDDLSPDATVTNHLRAIERFNQFPTLLLIGHQPNLGQLASLLLTSHSASWAIRKGAIWWLTGEGSQFSLRTVLTPRDI